MFKILLFLSFFALGNFARASHIMGGEINWKCSGGNYVFELILYRDCNGAVVNIVSENIQVWNHPSVSNILVSFISQTDISPRCTPVTGSPPQLACGTGDGGGNGIGAVSKIIYRSAPITLPGIPPAGGWIFTAVNFARSSAITNLNNASNYGITISATMFAVPNSPTGCVDNSPRFLQDPYMATCSGEAYQYNMNTVDDDLDSLAIRFDKPLNNFTTGTFNPPTSPIFLPYETGFSFDSPTPGTALNPNNVPATLNPTTGELRFTSFNIGNFVIKIIIDSYRNGVLIAQVSREIQIAVVTCNTANNAPTITGPFGGLFETTINAGDLVNFTLASSDVELLQDGTPQSNMLTASGLMFGTNFTSTTGCDIAPCATLNQTPSITGVQGVSTTFNWQTDCDHLVNQYGDVALSVPYHFVFKVQDDYCQVPKVKYATVTINVLNPGVIPATSIHCIQTLANNDLQISWNPVQNPNNSFVSYQIYSVENGLLATIPTINTTTSVIPAVNAENHFYLVVNSGCDGNVSLSSDTISNIFLELFNPGNGIAIVTWNDPITPANPTMNGYYHLYREYPAGVWNLFDSIPYGTTIYRDTIDICETNLGYQIVLPNTPCDFSSNIENDVFEDMTTPDIPVIYQVSIDTLTGLTTITWNQNGQADTYGYVIYQADADGILFEVDTVWGIGNTSYTFDPNTTDGALVFSVAAFDSCFTDLVPPTYQTSAKGSLHTTVFVSFTYNVCEQNIKLSWTEYGGWDAIQAYEIYAREGNAAWVLMGTTTDLFLNLPLVGLENYTFVVRAIHASGKESFSNKIVMSATAPSSPDFHYTKVATVSNKHVLIKHYIQATGGVTAILIEKKNKQNIFVPFANVPVVSDNQEFEDTEVDTDLKSYTYRVRFVDSCGNANAFANEVNTILLQVTSDDLGLKNALRWNSYGEFNGGVLNYNVYRGIDDVFSLIGVVSSTTTHFEDDLNNLNLQNGKICYLVDAIEPNNVYGFAEVSRSNFACPVFEPLIYIPNAFTPGGINPIFKPIVSLVDPYDYDFTVVNRWGQVVFHTNDINEGWDGTLPHNSSTISETAMYMYILKVKDGNQQEVIRRGHVSLLR